MIRRAGRTIGYTAAAATVLALALGFGFFLALRTAELVDAWL